MVYCVFKKHSGCRFLLFINSAFTVLFNILALVHIHLKKNSISQQLDGESNVPTNQRRHNNSLIKHIEVITLLVLMVVPLTIYLIKILTVEDQQGKKMTISMHVAPPVRGCAPSVINRGFY